MPQVSILRPGSEARSRQSATPPTPPPPTPAIPLPIHRHEIRRPANCERSPLAESRSSRPDWSVISRSPCSTVAPVAKATKLASALSRVKHAAGQRVADHSASVRHFYREVAQLVFPSGIPVALIASVTRMAFSGPLARHHSLTSSGMLWIPSQINSA